MLGDYDAISEAFNREESIIYTSTSVCLVRKKIYIQQVEGCK